MTISTDTLTPITLCPPRPMVGVVNGVSYLQEVQIGEHRVIALLDCLTRLHSVHGGQMAGIADLREIVRLARASADLPATCTMLLARHGYRLEASGE